MKLPKKKSKVELDIGKYLFLVYGREKIGKTVLFSQFPDALFLMTEPGAKGLEIYKVDIKNWQNMLDAVKALEKEDRFKTVIIDTVDNAYTMCLDHVCKRMGIDYPGEDMEGKADYGKSWREVKNEFTVMVNRIIATGRGLCFTSHAKIEEIKPKSSPSWNRVTPSMSSQASRVIEALVDFYFYADYMKDINGKNIRVLITEGDEAVWAGHREPAKFPLLLPLKKKGGYDVIVSGFKGEHKGLDPSSLLPTRQTAPAMKKLVADKKASGTVKKLKKKSFKKKKGD